MRDVWVVFPSASPERCHNAFCAWAKEGYYVAIGWDKEEVGRSASQADISINLGATYPGYWRSCDSLASAAVARGATCVVFAGDDMYPSETHNPQRLAAEYYERFPDGMGVMQPTGHKIKGCDVNTICGSPWVGRELVLCGVHHLGYMQFFGDQELCEVHKAAGTLWQRPEVSQFHDHWCLVPGKKTKTAYQIENDKYWAADHKLYQERKCMGFPK